MTKFEMVYLSLVSSVCAVCCSQLFTWHQIFRSVRNLSKGDFFCQHLDAIATVDCPGNKCWPRSFMLPDLSINLFKLLSGWLSIIRHSYLGRSKDQTKNLLRLGKRRLRTSPWRRQLGQQGIFYQKKFCLYWRLFCFLSAPNYNVDP